MPRSRSLRELVANSKGLAVENPSAPVNAFTPPGAQPTNSSVPFGEEALGGAIEGFKSDPNASLGDKFGNAVQGAKNAVVDDDTIQFILNLFK